MQNETFQNEHIVRHFYSTMNSTRSVIVSRMYSYEMWTIADMNTKKQQRRRRENKRKRKRKKKLIWNKTNLESWLAISIKSNNENAMKNVSLIWAGGLPDSHCLIFSLNTMSMILVHIYYFNNSNKEPFICSIHSL